MHRYTPCLKNVPPLACYNFDTREWILTFFGRNVVDKVSCHKVLYYATSSNLYFCTTWQNGKHGNCIFTRCISALPEFSQLLLAFFNLFDARFILTMLYDSLHLVINAFSFRADEGAWLRRKEVESAAAVGTVLHAQCTSALSSGFPLS